MKVFITGSTGGMGFESLKQLLKENIVDVILLARDSEKNHDILKKYKNHERVEIHWGDLEDYQVVYECVKEADLVLHIAAFVSPAADYFPKKAMKTNYGSTRNIIKAIFQQGRQEQVKFVYIGTVAETGDRLPPIHWGRVGDPIKPSMFDYYAVSKVAAERLVIESGLKYWVSLRQTGIMGPAMSRIQDAIMFHNCFNNVLEFVSDRDSGRLMNNLCKREANKDLEDDFWCHIYNIGGGESCRIPSYQLYKNLYATIGLTKLEKVLNPKWQATLNFHGQYYLDSDKLENYFHFRHDSMQYYYDEFKKELGATAILSRIICKFPGGQRLMGSILKRMFKKLALTEHGTARFISDIMEEHIEAYWGSKKKWEEIPEDMCEINIFSDWDKVVRIDHGYNEEKPENQLDLEDVVGAAKFRGGLCLSKTMIKGDWNTKLEWKCTFAHEFEASPRLVLEGGHWCPECERKSWNYARRSIRDPFFAQVWEPLHEKNETREYPKMVTELDI